MLNTYSAEEAQLPTSQYEKQMKKGDKMPTMPMPAAHAPRQPQLERQISDCPLYGYETKPIDPPVDEEQSATEKFMSWTSFGFNKTVNGFDYVFNKIADIFDITTPKYQMYIDEAERLGLNKNSRGNVMTNSDTQPLPISNMFYEARDYPNQIVTSGKGSKKKDMSSPEMFV